MFDVTGTDVGALGDADLRTLVARLALAELRAHGLPLSGVTAGGNQDAADGGLDVLVDVAATLPAPDFVPRARTGFQVKKPDMPASAILNEMAPGGVLRPVIAELAAAGGAYVIASAQGSVADKPLRDRKQAMADALAANPDAGRIHLDFYDRERVATWVNQYPGVAAWVRARVGRELNGWRGIGNWADGAVAFDKGYLCNDEACLIDETSRARTRLTIAQAIARLREELGTPRRAIRLIGLSGVGKTRLVQALFETGLSENPLDPALAVYTDYSEATDPTAHAMARRLVDSGQRAILIIDNCNPQTHAEVARICAGDAGQVSLVTVEYDVRDDEPEGTEVFRLEHASADLVETWLERNFAHVSQLDRRQIAQFADGNFRVARALADTLRRGENLGQLRNQELFERIFRQRNDPDPTLLRAAEDLALLYSFDGEDVSSESELARIAAIRGVSPNDLYAAAVELARRGVVQKRGRWRAILPQAIANPLAVHALERIAPAEFDRFSTGLPLRMLASVSRRLGYLHESEVAQQAVTRWLKQDGPLGDLLALGDPGMQILRNIAPVAPAVALSRIDAELTGSNGAAVLATRNRQRGQWIALIKQLAYDPALFDEAALALARFLAAEPAHHNHNSAGTAFSELFYLYLSGTQAPPEQRRAFVRTLCADPDPAMRRAAARALSALLQTNRFTSTSLHDFGARPRDFGWRPPSDEALADWCNAAIELVTELADRLENPRALLAAGLRSLWHIAQCHDALEAAATIFVREGSWIDGWLAARRALRHDGPTMPEAFRTRLLALIERLKPTNLLDQARAWVLTRSGGGFDLVDGETDIKRAWQEASAFAAELGRAFAADDAALATFLPELYAERSPMRAHDFGKGLAQGAEGLASLWTALTSAFAAMPEKPRNVTVLGGFLAEAARIDPEFAESVLDGIVEDPELGSLLAFLQVQVSVDASALERLRRAIPRGHLGAFEFLSLATGVIEPAPGAELSALLAVIATLDQGHAAALDIASMYFHGAQDAGHDFDPDVIACCRTLLAGANFAEQGALGDYGLKLVVEASLAGPDGEAPARKVCAHVREELDSYRLSSHQIGHLLEALFITQPMVALDELLLVDGEDGSLVEIRFDPPSPIGKLDAATLQRWADIDPDIRYPKLGEALSLFDGQHFGDETKLSPLFLEVLEIAPDALAFLGDARARIQPTSYSGSFADALERRRKLLGSLRDHSDPAVQAWHSEQERWLAEWIAAARMRESNREESFE